MAVKSKHLKKGRKTKRRQRQRSKNGPYNTQKSTVIQKALVCADRQYVKLRYIDVDTPNFAPSASGYDYHYYNGNGAWDVNPTVASTAMPGFAEWANFYNKFRVNAVKIEFECCNMESKPVMMLLHAQTEANPTNFSTWARIRQMEGNPYTKTRLLAPVSGQNRGKLSMYINYAKLNGDKSNYYNDLQYVGTTGGLGALTGANPVLNLYLFTMFITIDGSGFTALNNANKVSITQYIELFDRIDKIA